MTNTRGFFGFSERVTSTHDQVARILGMEILDGTHPAGANMPNEADLLARFQISRTVLREVLKTLSAKGMIASKTRVGTRVTDPVNWNFFDADVLGWKVALGLDDAFRRDMAEIRRSIEPRAAALAAERHRDADIDRIRAAFAAMAAPDSDAAAFARADLDFHLAIGAASGNPLMRSIASVIEAALVASFSPVAPRNQPDLHARIVAAHERILRAIERRDASDAADAMLAVIDDAAPRTEGKADR
jgi:DNA-binding FadR family transcriptional regulator